MSARRWVSLSKLGLSVRLPAAVQEGQYSVLRLVDVAALGANPLTDLYWWANRLRSSAGGRRWSSAFIP